MKYLTIPGFSRYSVSEHGHVRRDVLIHRSIPGQCSLVLNDRGYYKTSITDDEGRNRTLTVHTLVAAAFLGPRPDGAQVCHNDGDRRNNHYTNLRYDTPRANVRDSVRHGTYCHGSRHPGAKLDEAKVATIFELATTGLTQADIGRMFGVSQRAVWQVLQGHKWKHVVRAA